MGSFGSPQLPKGGIIMKYAIIKETETRIRILVEGPNSKIRNYSTVEYRPQPISDIHNLDAIALIVTPTDKGVDRISFMRLPAFKVTSDEELTDLILTHLSSRGFDLEKIDVLVYEANLGTDVMSAKAVQYGYYDEYAGIAVE